MSAFSDIKGALCNLAFFIANIWPDSNVKNDTLPFQSGIQASGQFKVFNAAGLSSSVKDGSDFLWAPPLCLSLLANRATVVNISSKWSQLTN